MAVGDNFAADVGADRLFCCATGDVVVLLLSLLFSVADKAERLAANGLSDFRLAVRVATRFDAAVTSKSLSLSCAPRTRFGPGGRPTYSKKKKKF